MLLSLLLGTVSINTILAPTELKLYYWWSPHGHTFDNPEPDPWKAYLFWLSPWRRMRDVDTTTIRLEGTIAPESTQLWLFNLIMIVSFDGYEVLGALLLKGGHMGPGQHVIYLEITGNMKDGTPFRGSASITLTIPN